MAETKTVSPRLVAKIVGRYVEHNTVAAGDLPNLIAIIHRSLAGLGQTPEASTPLTAAVAINRSHGRDFVVCLDCGWRGKMLRRHLTTAHGLSARDYRARWNLKDTHPLVAPDYSERRSTLAHQIGFGRGRQAATTTAEAETPPPKRRGRPRRTAPPPTSP
jgi:predicted transcriptional regulator